MCALPQLSFRFSHSRSKGVLMLMRVCVALVLRACVRMQSEMSEKEKVLVFWSVYHLLEAIGEQNVSLVCVRPSFALALLPLRIASWSVLVDGRCPCCCPLCARPAASP